MLGFFFGEGSIDHLLQLFHGTHFLLGEPAAANRHGEEMARLARRFQSTQRSQDGCGTT
jgi:hypothetical protein